MATSNQEILAQLEKLAERMPVIKTAAPLPVQRRQDPIIFPTNAQYDEADMRIILAAVKRWVKIEEVAKPALLALRHCDGELSAIKHRGTIDEQNVSNFSAEARATAKVLDAALKEPS